MRFVLSAAATAALLAIAAPAFAGQDDLCRDPAELQDAAFRAACEKLEDAKRNRAAIEGMTQALRAGSESTLRALESAPQSPLPGAVPDRCLAPEDLAVRRQCALYLFLRALHGRTLPFRAL